MKIGIFSIGYSQLAVIFPLVVSAPRYFAKAIKLGDLMQIGSAFGRVQDAFSYFIIIFVKLSSLLDIIGRGSAVKSMMSVGQIDLFQNTIANRFDVLHFLM